MHVKKVGRSVCFNEEKIIITYYSLYTTKKAGTESLCFLMKSEKQGIEGTFLIPIFHMSVNPNRYFVKGVLIFHQGAASSRRVRIGNGVL